MKGLIYFGYAIAIIGVSFLIAGALKGLFAAWRDSGEKLSTCPNCYAPLELFDTDYGERLVCYGCGWE